VYILCYTNIGLWLPLTSRPRGPQTYKNLKLFLVFIMLHFAVLAVDSDPRFLKESLLIISGVMWGMGFTDKLPTELYVLLNLNLGIIFVNNQLDTQFFWHGYVLHEGITYISRVPRTSQMTSHLLRHTATAMRAHNVLCNSYNSITVEMNHCSFCRVRFALLYIVTRSKIV
jgi:hypothetical protein